MIPFMTEEIYQNLVRGIDANAPESIHLCDFPVCDDEADRSTDLEANMEMSWRSSSSGVPPEMKPTSRTASRFPACL
jgi:isoleucyl-tRNA synthetase